MQTRAVQQFPPDANSGRVNVDGPNVGRHDQQHSKGSKASERLDTVLEISSFILTTLSDAANFAPVPFLQQAAGLTLGFVQLAQQAKGNKQLFKGLAEDSCRLVYSVAVIYAEREREGGQQPDDLNNDVGNLVSTLTSIDKFSRKQASRNFFLRMVFSQRDAESVRDYRERLKHSLDVFWLQSSIRIRENLSQISKQQGQMYQALQDQGEGRLSAKGSSRSQPSRLEVLSATHYQHEIFKNHSTTYNEVSGDQVNTINSGNTTTTKIVHSIIGGGGGQGGDGATGGSGGSGGNVTLRL